MHPVGHCLFLRWAAVLLLKGGIPMTRKLQYWRPALPGWLLVFVFLLAAGCQAPVAPPEPAAAPVPTPTVRPVASDECRASPREPVLLAGRLVAGRLPFSALGLTTADDLVVRGLYLCNRSSSSSCVGLSFLKLDLGAIPAGEGAYQPRFRCYGQDSWRRNLACKDASAPYVFIDDSWNHLAEGDDVHAYGLLEANEEHGCELSVLYIQKQE
jgi:hypothetical protein